MRQSWASYGEGPPTLYKINIADALEISLGRSLQFANRCGCHVHAWLACESAGRGARTHTHTLIHSRRDTHLQLQLHVRAQ